GGRGAFEDQIIFVHYRPAGRACSIAFRPASVIFMRTTSTGRPPATIRSGVAIARPAMHRSTSRGTGKRARASAPLLRLPARRRSLSSRCARDGIGRLPPWVGVSNAYGTAATYRARRQGVDGADGHRAAKGHISPKVT